MIQEIVFTSARQGLRTGSTGFCTVRSTRGMPGNLAQLLERLTSYSHVFDAYGDQANLNPVNFAHYIARLGDQKLHILARVSNAPLDHTNRSNKLAHMLAVESSQLATALSEGPAAESLKVPWIRDWSSDTEPSVLPDEKQLDLPMLDQPKSGPCNAWKEATGDAGWAAVLASSAGETSNLMQVILPRDVGSRDETWALQLVHEALSLLPPACRWDVSYSTFFGGNLPVSINCRWQFILDGTDAAKRARLDPRAKTIDIPGIAARKIPAPLLPLTPLTNVATRPWDDHQEDAIARRRPRVNSDASISDASTQATSADMPRVEHPDAVIDEKLAFAVSPERSISVVSVSLQRSRRKRRPVLLRPASLLVLGTMVVVTLVLAVQPFPVAETGAAAKIMAEANEKASHEEQQKRKQKSQTLMKAEDQVAQAKQQQAADEQAKLLASSGHTSKNVGVPNKTVHTPPPPAQNPPSREPAFTPLQNVRDLGNRLQISIPRVGLNSGLNGPIHLAKIYVDSRDHFTLKKIIGGRSVLKPGLDFSLEEKDSKEQLFRDWDVIRQSMTGVNLGGNPDVVGTFRLDQNWNLSFRWHKDNEGFEIINCMLEMEAGNPEIKPEREKCTLREVHRVKPLQFDLSQAELMEQLVSRNQLTNTEALRFHYEFMNLPGHVTRTGPTILAVGDAVKFRIQGEPNGKYRPTIEIMVKLLATDQDVHVTLEMTLKMPAVDQANRGCEMKQFSFTPSLMVKTNDNLKSFSDEIDKQKKLLKKARMELEILQADARKLVENKADFKSRDLKTREMDAQDAIVKNINREVDAMLAELDQLKLLAQDLNTMLESIAANSKLQFSLRLMIPDAGATGIELVRTDDGVAAE